jgi:hypothetical protein
MNTNIKIKHLFVASMLFATTSFISCNETESDKETDPTSTEIKVPEEAKNTPTEAPIQSEAELKSFLFSKEGTYGWQTTADSIMFDFFKDGRLHIQGPDGEATMWEGKWELKGNQLTMISEEKKINETKSIQMKGDTLVLGDKTYTRYTPVQ